MAKKRKKKVYNTPKKIKHVHKNEKLFRYSQAC